MRPIRLELEGFTAYREFTVLDFDDSDLFVLTGPTGAGKSSLIDAMTFALYGSVARYGNPNLVHPVISQGKLEAKVRFDFSLRGQTYTAVRVVRRTQRGGATTREARLEMGGQVLAGSADEVSRKVRELLGLNFEQFTTCVVLPQGEFARFLHEKPADRQDLLTRLLGVEIYERMGGLARTRETTAKQKAEIYQEELTRLGEVSRADEKRLARRVSRLEKLVETIQKTEPRLAELAKKAEAARSEAARHERDEKLLASLEVPAGVEALAETLQSSRAACEGAQNALADAVEGLRNAEAKREKLPSAVAIHEVERLNAELEAAREGLQTVVKSLARAEKRVAEAKERHASAKAAADAARGLLQRLESDHAAHAVAKHLVKGEPCPVCGVTVTSLPKRAAPKALATAESDLGRAETARATSEQDLREADKALALASERRSGLEKDISVIEKKLTKSPSPRDIAAAAELDETLASLKRAFEKARVEASRRQAELEKLETKETRAYQELEKARDRVASLEPPATDRAKLGETWMALARWARELASGLRQKAISASATAQGYDDEREKLLHDLRAEAGELDVTVHGDKLRDSVYTELVNVRHALETLRASLERVSTLQTDLKAATESAAVAGVLGRHLRASGFERWLLTEAFRQLASQATIILKELSSGQYSFEYDDRLNFEVVDHRNADERRSARTLSGGESFLASLALALTLAEQTAELAASGSAPLESLFLDEGFGTLDNETLEIVATAIQELGARGRVVGLVTHQQSLADQIPVQFRVSKGPITSTVEKVSA